MQTLTKYWFLEDFNLFKKLGRITMMRMCQILEMENIPKGSLITLHSEHRKSMFFLKRGLVKIVDKNNDDLKYIVKPGNIFGELSLYDKTIAAQEEAYALKDCIICYIEAEDMEALMEKHKSLKNGILKVYGNRIKRLERKLHDLLYKDSWTRIHEFIIDFVEQFGEPNEDGTTSAQNILTHKEIASLTNTSRQTVSNVLSTMRKQGDLDYDTKHITLLKAKPLEEKKED